MEAMMLVHCHALILQQILILLLEGFAQPLPPPPFFFAPLCALTNAILFLFILAAST
jgi:hypothetical protein